MKKPPEGSKALFYPNETPLLAPKCHLIAANSDFGLNETLLHLLTSTEHGGALQKKLQWIHLQRSANKLALLWTCRPFQSRLFTSTAAPGRLITQTCLESSR